MKGEDLTVLEQTSQLTHKHSYLRLPSQSDCTKKKNLPRSLVKFAERKSALLQNKKL